MQIQFTLNQTIELNLNQKAFIKDIGLKIHFIKAGSDHGENHYGYHAFFKISINDRNEQEIFVETINSKAGKVKYQNFTIHLLYSNGIDNVKIKITGG